MKSEIVEPKSTDWQPPDPREIWDQPEPQTEMVWAICDHIDGRHLEPCKRCPKWDEHVFYGKGQRGCYGMAAEACRIVFAMQAREVARAT